MPKSDAEVDRVLETMWCELLKVPEIAPADNFLDLGGNSLRAGELVLRIRSQLGIEVPIDVVLSEDSFATMARTVREMLAGAETSPV
jgi:acyl carrier protein